MKNEKEIKESKNKESIDQYIRFSGIVFQMIVVICSGVYLGTWLDEKFVNDFSVFTVCFSIFSVFTSVFLVFKQVKEINKHQ